jgi:hypothetical protein
MEQLETIMITYRLQLQHGLVLGKFERKVKIVMSNGM